MIWYLIWIDYSYPSMRAALVVCVFPGLLSSGWNHSDVSNLSSWICTTQFLPSTRTFQKLSTPSPVKVDENSYKCTQYCHKLVHKKYIYLLGSCIQFQWSQYPCPFSRFFFFFSNDHFILQSLKKKTLKNLWAQLSWSHHGFDQYSSVSYNV